MKLVILASLFVAACAGQSSSPPFHVTQAAARAPAPRAAARSEAPRQFPALASEAAIDFGATDDLKLRRNHGEPATQLRVCIAPTGAVDNVDLIASSGQDKYDRAVLEAARNWKFQAVAQARCTRMSVIYRTI